MGKRLPVDAALPPNRSHTGQPVDFMPDWWEEDELTLGDEPFMICQCALEDVISKYEHHVGRPPSLEEVCTYFRHALNTVGADSLPDLESIEVQSVNIRSKKTPKRQNYEVGDYFAIPLEGEYAFRRISGPRAMLYLLCSQTGLRAQEAASLTAASFNLDSVPSTIEVEAGYSKRRRKDTIPLRAEFAELLCEWLRGRDGLLWPGSWWNIAAQMVEQDLKRPAMPGSTRRRTTGRNARSVSNPTR